MKLTNDFNEARNELKAIHRDYRADAINRVFLLDSLVDYDAEMNAAYETDAEDWDEDAAREAVEAAALEFVLNAIN